MFRRFGRNLCARAESGGEDMYLRMSFGFFGADHSVLHQAPHIGMIVGQTRDVHSPHQIQAAIADVGVVKLIPQKGDRSSRSTHTVELWMSRSAIENAFVCDLETGEQQGLYISIRSVGKNFLD